MMALESMLSITAALSVLGKCLELLILVQRDQKGTDARGVRLFCKTAYSILCVSFICISQIKSNLKTSKDQ